MAFNGVGQFSLNPQETIEIFGRFGNGEDHGAQYFSANPTFDTAGFSLVMSRQSKIREADGTITYAVTVFNNDNSQGNFQNPVPIFFDMQGGGFINGFNGIGSFSVAAGQSVEFHDWTFPNGQDLGAQYFSANPITRGGHLVMSRQNKTRHPNGSVSYGFNVENASPDQDVIFDVQGGGFAGGVNEIGRATINPSDTIFMVATIGNDEDHGAQYFSANATDRAGSLVVMSDQQKGRDLQGGAFYGFTATNEDIFPVFCDFQGGGFI